MERDIRADRVERVEPGGVRRARWGRYLPIAEHGLIGDPHTVALVGTDGTRRRSQVRGLQRRGRSSWRDYADDVLAKPRDLLAA